MQVQLQSETKEIKTSSGLYWATQYNPEEVLISLMINMNPGCPQFSKIKVKLIITFLSYQGAKLEKYF